MHTSEGLRALCPSEIETAAAAGAIVARLASEKSEIAAALERARLRLSKIDETLRYARSDAPKGERAADALLAGEPVNADHADVSRLEGEREALRDGISALYRRDTDVSRDLVNARADLRAALAAAIDPIALAIRERVRRALQDLAQAYCDAEGIRLATGNLRALEVTTHVRGFLFRAAVEKLVARTLLRPSDDVLAALPDPELVKAAGGHVPAVIDWPSHP